jgi:diguanylate cyclase (GGDEF)-like protein
MDGQLELRLNQIMLQASAREKRVEQLLQRMMKLGALILRAEWVCLFLPSKWTHELTHYQSYPLGRDVECSMTGRELAQLFDGEKAPWMLRENNLYIPLFVNGNLHSVLYYANISDEIQGDRVRMANRIVKQMNLLFESKLIQTEKDNYHAALVQISDVIAHTERYEEAMKQAMEMASEVAGGICGIMLLSKDKQSIIPVYTRNVGHEDLQQIPYPPLPGHDQTAYLAITQRRVIFVEDTAADPFVDREFCEKYDIKSYMTLPLFIHEKEIGILFVDYSYHHTFTKQEVNFFSELGQQISHVLYSLQTRQELLHNKRIQDRLIEMMRDMTSRIRMRDVLKDMVDRTYGLLQEKVGVSVWLTNDAKDHIKLASWQGATLRLDKRRAVEFSFEELGNAALLQDLFLEVDTNSSMGRFFHGAGLECSIGTPLMAGKELTGILFLHALEGHQWTEQEKLTLSAIGIHAGPIIRHGQYIQMLEKQSKLDGLTKVFNRQHFEKMFREYGVRHMRHAKPFTLLMMDLDNFKQINDQYGHLVGDDVMRSVAQILMDTIRRSDKAFRYGGEEFAVLLPWTGKDEAEQVAERIRANIEAAHFNPPVTVSIGLATFLETARQPEEVIELADLALYKAKNRGKNRVVSAL